MVYYDNTGRRIRLQVKCRTPSSGGGVDDTKARYIRQVAAGVPKFTPAEVHAEIHYSRGRQDIPLEMVREVLAEVLAERS